MQLKGFGRVAIAMDTPPVVDLGARLAPSMAAAASPIVSSTSLAPAQAFSPAPAPMASVKVAQSQIDPTAAAQSLSVPEIKALPSPLKEQTVVAAVTIGRQDVTQAAAKEMTNSQVEALPSPAREIVAATKAETAGAQTPATIDMGLTVKGGAIGGTVSGPIGSTGPIAQTGVGIDPRAWNDLQVQTRDASAQALDASRVAAAVGQQLQAQLSAQASDTQVIARQLQGQLQAQGNAIDAQARTQTGLAASVQAQIDDLKSQVLTSKNVTAAVPPSLQAQLSDLIKTVNAMGETLGSLEKWRVDQIQRSNDLAQSATQAMNLAKAASAAAAAGAQVDLSEINAQIGRHEESLNYIISDFVKAWDAARSTGKVPSVQASQTMKAWAARR